MGWSLGFDDHWNRDVGYGVPAVCDYPGCGARIDRGLSHVCGDGIFGGDTGCGLYFCGKHLWFNPQRCDRCTEGKDPFEPTPDVEEWVNRKKQCKRS